jgi:hypothetical protein
MHHKGELYSLHSQHNMPKSLITISSNLTACILTPRASTDYDAHQTTGSTSCRPASHANATLQEAMHVLAHRTLHFKSVGYCDWLGVPFLGTKGTAAYMHASCGFCALIGWLCPFNAGQLAHGVERHERGSRLLDYFWMLGKRMFRAEGDSDMGMLDIGMVSKLCRELT